METRIIKEEVKQYWNLIFGQEVFGTDETARIVMQAQVKPEFNDPINIEKYQLKNILMTENTQIRSADDLINYIEAKERQLPKHNIGISISSAIFNYDPTILNEKGNVKAPSINSFKKINTIVFDIDAHIPKSKERFFLFNLEEKYQNLLIARAYLELSLLLKKHGLPLAIPAFTMISGGGLQIAFKFDRDLYSEEAKLIFGRLKSIFHKKTFEVLTKDFMGNFTNVELEIDPTFADISHTQRLAGIINQKYGYIPTLRTIFSTSFMNYKNLEEVKELLKNYFIEIQQDLKDSSYDNAMKNKMKIFFQTLIKEFGTVLTNLNSTLLEEGNPPELIPTDIFKEDAKIANIQNKININPNELSNVEFDIINELKHPFNLNALEALKLAFPDKEFYNHGTYFKMLCPFHEERTPSMSFYPNSLIFRDFHDDTNYSIIDFYSKIYDVNKTVAIQQLTDRLGIKLKRSNKKDFEELELDDLISKLLEKIDTENYIYYRLANKNRACIIREKNTGESFVFDGPKMLSNHIVVHQLNIPDADKKFLEKFQYEFERKILIEAFEEFHPGKPTVFSKGFIQFVNLWVPSSNYKRAHELAKTIKNEEFPDGINLEKAIKLFKERTPWTFKYIQQITQKGNLSWFINWLANGSHFKVMPTIPVIFGVPGVGKNLFVSTILEWYHNNEYTKVLNSDRVMSNFNSMLEDASLLVLDEGNISSAKEFDALKFLSGNDKIAIEKKGIDAKMQQRHFNIILFSNGETPVRHDFSDRRIQYFYTERTLLQSVKNWKCTIEELIENIKLELSDFWAILLNIKTNPKWNISNEKDKVFMIQVLRQHSFGELVLKLLNGAWKEVALQLNENISDPTIMKANLELLQEIKKQFEVDGKVSLTIINRYLQSLNFKYKTSIQRFIQQNNLQELGIDIEILADDVKIIIDKTQLKRLNNISNNLDIKDINRAIKKLNDVDSELFEAEKEIDNVEAKVEAENIESSEKLDIPKPPLELDIPKPPL